MPLDKPKIDYYLVGVRPGGPLPGMGPNVSRSRVGATRKYANIRSGRTQDLCGARVRPNRRTGPFTLDNLLDDRERVWSAFESGILFVFRDDLQEPLSAQQLVDALDFEPDTAEDVKFPERTSIASALKQEAELAEMISKVKFVGPGEDEIARREQALIQIISQDETWSDNEVTLKAIRRRCATTSDEEFTEVLEEAKKLTATIVADQEVERRMQELIQEFSRDKTWVADEDTLAGVKQRCAGTPEEYEASLAQVRELTDAIVADQEAEKVEQERQIGAYKNLLKAAGSDVQDEIIKQYVTHGTVSKDTVELLENSEKTHIERQRTVIDLLAKMSQVASDDELVRVALLPPDEYGSELEKLFDQLDAHEQEKKDADNAELPEAPEAPAEDVSEGEAPPEESPAEVEQEGDEGDSKAPPEIVEEKPKKKAAKKKSTKAKKKAAPKKKKTTTKRKASSKKEKSDDRSEELDGLSGVAAGDSAKPAEDDRPEQSDDQPRED
jgi:hypothetical protein